MTVWRLVQHMSRKKQKKGHDHNALTRAFPPLRWTFWRSQNFTLRSSVEFFVLLDLTSAKLAHDRVKAKWEQTKKATERGIDELKLGDTSYVRHKGKKSYNIETCKDASGISLDTRAAFRVQPGWRQSPMGENRNRISSSSSRMVRARQEGTVSFASRVGA